MGNHLAIATVTAALRQAIQNALDSDVPGAKAQVGRPEGANGQDATPLVNLFLYQAVPNAAARNAHMPSRGADGRSHGASALAMDLHYLISFSGASKSYDAERLLGSVARALEDRPIITRALIEKVVHDDPGSLGQSDLARAVEVPRAHPLNLNLDEMSKLWSVLFQVPYVLSVAYKLGAVVVETSLAGSPGPPVTRIGIGVVPMDGPAIEAIEAAGGPLRPIVWGGTIAVKGRDMSRHGLQLRMGGHDAVLNNATITPGRIELALAAATFGGSELAAGPVLVQTVLPPPVGALTHLERITDSATFVLRPTLTLAAGAVVLDPGPGPLVDGRITVTVAPKVRDGQTVRLLLDERVALDPLSRQLAPDPVAPAQFPLGSLRFSFKQLRRSTYYAQLLIDGVTSPATVDLDPASATFQQITGPQVVIP